jgi:hypothetical protein
MHVEAQCIAPLHACVFMPSRDLGFGAFHDGFLADLALVAGEQATDVVMMKENHQSWPDHQIEHGRQAHQREKMRVRPPDKVKHEAADHGSERAYD